MVLGVVGISYREAALKEREAVINILKDFEADSFFSQRFFGDDGSFVLLLTCHRAEIYYFSKSNRHVQSKLLSRISSLGARPYCYQGLACFTHLFTVTSGMDSLISGETEIQGQVKRAYIKAKTDRELPFALHFLFQKALKEGKDFRSQVSLSHPVVTIESVVEETLDLHGKSTKDKLLFIGYSDINRKIAKGLSAKGYRNLIFCSRKNISIPYDTVARSQLSFREPYDVIFFGSSESAKDFSGLSLESLASIPNRVIFDFNVPRTFTLAESPKDIICLDMDFISERVQKKLQISKQCTDKEKPFLALAARKQWEVYEKKSSHIPSSQVRASRPKLLIL
ncbi:glutamyl-tRNA reductase [Chlamydia psittaci]|uniref:Glutamyl-tRNA reductase n=1 Tax=Chlamydia psittaci 99DC5 TaxID=1112251 RepID=A0ABN0MPN4_CHLPS|nr:glutamyl-tRNA reductase [Chlamydia psittaci]AGE74601.1 glutamyl-tRNA reductase [Chlamydia psittaci Mat116]EPJ15851.1 glutamyl-tRNAGlu reductase, N-terminal domain protein [Chlamydia psittaci 02DC18]EPJ16994.1 glutamyl-tRNAGlu reductase, N-terminal domain protein [Chlamydia psittaci 02DC22]EPJ19709.1 glutamyl-tRNAGlu reductase, N-terminal domain protein [Chlamydia psittaci 02DC23]EPJ20812.1 glutamyl-tRNAGlu reductase, N-terminal domain protein [Chlamydia psittaci 02DC21]EPJ24580.1 glutamyl-